MRSVPQEEAGKWRAEEPCQRLIGSAKNKTKAGPCPIGLRKVHLLSARCAGWTGWPTSSRSFSVTIFSPDVTTKGLGLLESVVGSESGHHVGMCGNEDPLTDPWDLQSGIYEGDGFHPRHSFSGWASSG